MDSSESKNVIKVNGEGTVTAVPNQASATIGVITEGKDLTLVQQQNSETITRVVNVLDTFNIPRTNIQTFDYHVDSQYDYVDGKQLFRGYRVQTLLKITINEVKELGRVINSIIEAGANYVSNVQFTVSNPNEYYLRALKKAMKNAHEKAETIVLNLKVKWNSIPFRIEELGRESRPIQPQLTFVKGATSEQFQPGILQFKAAMSVKYYYY